MSNLQKHYTENLAKKLSAELGVKNAMATPKLLKITLNMGVKDALSDKKNIEKAEGILGQIAGQKPRVMKAKKSIAAFKLREGDPIAVMVTLRGKRMYDFFEKMVGIVLPRLRDFHGVSNRSFDKLGNYTLGLSEYTVFPEIDAGKVDKIQGLQVCITTSAKNNMEGMALLKSLGMPFEKS